MKESTKLKPCPFCGAEARLEQIRGDNHNYWADGLFYIVADHDWRSCPLYAVTFGHYGGGYDKETGEYSPMTDKAVKACEKWNRRADNEQKNGCQSVS